MRLLPLALAATLAPIAVSAQSLVEAGDPDRLVELLHEGGYVAERTTDGVGDPMIDVTLPGTSFEVYFYDCTDGSDCLTLQLSSGYDLPDGMSLERANEWNRDKRYATVYLDEEDDPFLQMDLNIDYGVTDKNFIDNVKMYVRLVGKFEDYIDW